MGFQAQAWVCSVFELVFACQFFLIADLAVGFRAPS